MIGIEIIDGCNFKCWFCRAKDLDGYSFMELDIFKQTILEAKELGIKTVDMIPSRGDPFLHPNIYEMLDFANEHMSDILIFTNATPINVRKLKDVNLSRTKLCISLYGKNAERFIELTQTTEEMFNIFENRIKELSAAGIKYSLERRDVNYKFDAHGQLPPEDFNPKEKCRFHHVPKVLVDGSVTFCRTAWSANGLSIGNLHERSLHDLLADPIRYKFMDSQSICVKYCDSYTISCNSQQTFAAMKLMSESKIKYNKDTARVDAQYAELENAIIQRTK